MNEQSQITEGVERGDVRISRELYDFLMGAGEIDGTSFGDLNAGLPGRFWWRALLSAAAMQPQADSQQGLVEALRELRSWLWPDDGPGIGPSAPRVAAVDAAIAALSRASAEPVPIPMLLFCPNCGLQHIDEPDERTPDWDNPPHKSHLCHECGAIWRQADVPTTGVAKIETYGKADNWFPHGRIYTWGDEAAEPVDASPQAEGRDDDAERQLALEMCQALRVDAGQITLSWAREFIRKHRLAQPATAPQAEVEELLAALDAYASNNGKRMPTQRINNAVKRAREALATLSRPRSEAE